MALLSPPPVVRSTVSTVVSAPSTAIASTLDAEVDVSPVTLPLRILCGTQAMEHEPPSSDCTPASKRSRRSVSIDPQFAPLPASTEEEDTDAMVNNAASHVRNLTLEPIPRSPSSESEMQL
jgi:hypothetical protein